MSLTKLFGISLAGGGGAGMLRSVTITSGSFSVGATASTDYLYLIAGAHTPTMPTAVGNTNQYTFKNNHTAAVAFAVTSSQTIDGDTGTNFFICPNEEITLWSNGTNWESSVRRQWRIITKPSDQTKTSDTTLAADTYLQVPYWTSFKLQFDLMVFFNGSGGGNFKYDLNMPALGGIYWSRETVENTTRTENAGISAIGSTSLTGGVLGTLHIRGQCNLGANGTWAFRWAQDTSDPSPGSIVYGGSSLAFCIGGY